MFFTAVQSHVQQSHVHSRLVYKYTTATELHGTMQVHEKHVHIKWCKVADRGSQTHGTEPPGRNCGSGVPDDVNTSPWRCLGDMRMYIQKSVQSYLTGKHRLSARQQDSRVHTTRQQSVHAAHNATQHCARNTAVHAVITSLTSSSWHCCVPVNVEHACICICQILRNQATMCLSAISWNRCWNSQKATAAGSILIDLTQRDSVPITRSECTCIGRPQGSTRCHQHCLL
jgi:hypothetical protein